MHVDDLLKERAAVVEGAITEEERAVSRQILSEAVPEYTGPVKIRKALDAAIAARRGHSPSESPLRASRFRTGEWMVDRLLMDRFKGIDWVAEGSKAEVPYAGLRPGLETACRYVILVAEWVILSGRVTAAVATHR